MDYEYIDDFLANHTDCAFLEVTRPQPYDRENARSEWQFNIEGNNSAGKRNVSELFYYTGAEADLHFYDDFNEEYHLPVEALKARYPQLKIKNDRIHHTDERIH